MKEVKRRPCQSVLGLCFVVDTSFGNLLWTVLKRMSQSSTLFCEIHTQKLAAFPQATPKGVIFREHTSEYTISRGEWHGEPASLNGLKPDADTGLFSDLVSW